MRTTLTLERDVALKLKKRMAAEKRSLKRMVNEALRAGLDANTPRTRTRVEPLNLRLKPGIDSNKLHQLLDELVG
jgi:ArsR family metal-binding transcriptional regulator